MNDYLVDEMNLPIPRNASEEGTESGDATPEEVNSLAGLGNFLGNIQENDENNTPDEATQEQPGTESAKTDTGDEDESSETNLSELFNNPSQNKAFAEMRVLNKSAGNIIGSLSKMMNINADGLTQQELFEQVGKNMTEFQAKQGGYDPAIIQENDRLQKEIIQLKQRDAELSADSGFAALQKKHALPGKELETFARKLLEDGKNPYVDPSINIVAEYENMFHDAIIEKQVAARVEAELAKQQTAQRGATVSKKTGANGSSSGETINSVKDLENFFKDVDV